MPEPLKNKGEKIVLDNHLYFKDEKITSAVEWLKLRKMKFICKNGVKHTNTPVVFWSDVEEAFEDVLK